MKIIPFFKKAVKITGFAVIACTFAVLVVNFFVVVYGNRYVVQSTEVEPGYDCIIVLGCSVHGDTPSDMLRDRLDRAVYLYESGVSATILMSGDGTSRYYDEVGVMKNYAVENGVPASAIITDSSGLSTYETMYRAKEEYGIENPLIVTQKFHLYRSLYDARKMGMEADGTESIPNTYVSQLRMSAREILARNKDFIFMLFKPEPAVLNQ